MVICVCGVWLSAAVLCAVALAFAGRFCAVCGACLPHCQHR